MDKFDPNFPSLVLDDDGVAYHDLNADWGVSLIGAGNSYVVDEYVKQVRAKCYVENLFPRLHENALRGELHEIFGDDCLILPSTTGSEAVEIAFRLVRKATKKKNIIYAKGAYHGNTYSAYSACGISNFGVKYEKDLENYMQIDFHDIDSISELKFALSNNEIAGIILEPIPANSCYRQYPCAVTNFLNFVYKEHGVPVIADEISSGLGRCGCWTSAEVIKLKPQITLIGKGLANGVAAISALILSSELARFAKGHALRSTMAWTPASCAGAAATIRHIKSKELIRRANKLGLLIGEELLKLKRFPIVSGVYCVGMGFGVGIVENRSSKNRMHIMDQMKNRGYLVGVNPVLPGIRMSPPLNVNLLTMLKAIKELEGVLLNMEM